MDKKLFKKIACIVMIVVSFILWVFCSIYIDYARVELHPIADATRYFKVIAPFVGGLIFGLAIFGISIAGTVLQFIKKDTQKKQQEKQTQSEY